MWGAGGGPFCFRSPGFGICFFRLPGLKHSVSVVSIGKGLTPHPGRVAVNEHDFDLLDLAAMQVLLALPGVSRPVEQGFLGRRAAFQRALDRLLGNLGRRVGPSDQDFVGELGLQDFRRDLDLELQAENGGNLGDRNVVPGQLSKSGPGHRGENRDFQILLPVDGFSRLRLEHLGPAALGSLGHGESLAV